MQRGMSPLGAQCTAWRELQGFAEGASVRALVVLLLTVAVSGAVYVGAARLLRVEELGLVWGVVRRRVRR